MRKELSFAIILGVLIGLVFTFGVLRVNTAIKKNSLDTSNADNIKEKQVSEQVQDPNQSLTLLKPINRQVFGEDLIQITGVTKTGSYIIATGGTSDVITKSDNGSFDIQYEIEPALNHLNISSVSPENIRSSVKLELVYSSEAIQKDTNETSKPSDSKTGNEMDVKIEDKLEKAQNISEFFIGTITDLTDGGIQIKNTDGEIKQISFTDGTTFAKIGKITTKITISDIAIGDYILALGYKNDSGVLDSFRILVTQPTQLEDIKIFFGTVSVKNKSDIEIAEQNTGNITIGIDNNTKTFSGDLLNPDKILFTNIKKDNLVIGTYITEKNINVTRRIYTLTTANN